ncbi:twin-arginine translocase TatA/TatE family subunit [Dehalococcoidia bacterium]|nr:twin-arginine translocase TatA/TatE family subunit [Dehalococcoidia bacterium]
MEFLNASPLEIIVILVVAFVILGPERVADVASSLGRITRNLRANTADLTREIVTGEIDRHGPLVTPVDSGSERVESSDQDAVALKPDDK